MSVWSAYALGASCLDGPIIDFNLEVLYLTAGMDGAILAVKRVVPHEHIDGTLVRHSLAYGVDHDKCRHLVVVNACDINSVRVSVDNSGVPS